MNKTKAKSGNVLGPVLVVIVAVVLGVVLGIGSSRARVAKVPVDVRHLQDRKIIRVDEVDNDVEDESLKDPKVEVHPGISYDFGTMARDSKQRHTFVFRNVGRAPLTLEYLDSTCKCTIGELDKTEVAPLGEANVTLEWTADSYDLDFRQSARIKTNDHLNETVSLTVYGKVQQIIRPVPHNLALTSISQQSPLTAVVNIYAYRDDNFEVMHPEFTNEDQDYFDLEIRKLTEAEVAEEPDAKSGVRLTFTSEVGIPVGPVEQSVQMETNLKDVQLLEIPIKGVVVSDISVIPGRHRYHKQRQRFRFDPINGKEGAEFEAFLLVKGEHGASVELTPINVDPGFMEIKIGEKRKVGKAHMYPLTIKIPPGTKPINRKGSDQGELAEFTIKTSHPDVPEMRFEVELYVF